MALAGFVALGALLLIYEHRLHIPFGNLLLLLPLLASFGLHSLMHGGHGGHGGHGDEPRQPDQADLPDRQEDTRP